MPSAFTRRHYEKIAKVIQSLYQTPNVQRVVAQSFIQTLKEDNPRFNEDKFLRACTVVDLTKPK